MKTLGTIAIGALIGMAMLYGWQNLRYQVYEAGMNAKQVEILQTLTNQGWLVDGKLTCPEVE